MDLAYLNAIPTSEFHQRRQRLFEQMQENSIALLTASTEKFRNNDCTYPFRQDSYFWYLTGFNEPEAMLILIKTLNQTQSIIFVRAKNPEQEIWHGRRLGVELAAETLGIDHAFAIDEFDEHFNELIKTKNIHTLYTINASPTKGFEFEQIFDLTPILAEMRLFKSRNEIVLLQQAGQISALAHIRAMREARPNRFEYELASEILYEFNRHGARFEAYSTIVASGENACILHYTANDKPLKDGELVLIDAGCEFAMYAGDISRTFPVNGKFTTPQRELYSLVLSCQKYAIQHLVPDANIQAVNDGMIKLMVEGLVALGIMQGEVDELIEKQAHRQFYMHGLGHWLGLDVHDVGAYSLDPESADKQKCRNRPLEVGMVLTVEPGIYISETADVPAQYKGIGIRIEDNILITEYGNKVLTSAAPKEIDEIEALMQKA